MSMNTSLVNESTFRVLLLIEINNRFLQPCLGSLTVCSLTAVSEI